MRTIDWHLPRIMLCGGVFALAILDLSSRAEAQVCNIEAAGFTTIAPVQVLVDAGNTVVPDLLISRDNGFRVSSLISADDAQRVVDAMGIAVDVDPDGNGTTTISIDVTQLESRRYNDSGPCHGRNTKSYKRTMVLLLLGRDANGDFNIPIPEFWTDAPAPVSPFADPNASIDTRLDFQDDGDKRMFMFKGKTTSADNVSKVSIEIQYQGALPFANNSADFKAIRLPIYFANQETGERVRFWCSPQRTRATLLPSDPNLQKAEIDVGKNGKLCLNGLEDASGTVCVNLLRDDEGNKPLVTNAQVYRYAGLKCEIDPL